MSKMLEEFWGSYGWVVLVIGLIILNALFLKPTKRIVSGFHRGVNYTKKETLGDIVQGIIFLMLLGYVVYLLISSLF